VQLKRLLVQLKHPQKGEIGGTVPDQGRRDMYIGVGTILLIILIILLIAFVF
jgi:hypothetical protein